MSDCKYGGRPSGSGGCIFGHPGCVCADELMTCTCFHAPEEHGPNGCRAPKWHGGTCDCQMTTGPAAVPMTFAKEEG